MSKTISYLTQKYREKKLTHSEINSDAAWYIQRSHTDPYTHTNFSSLVKERLKKTSKGIVVTPLAETFNRPQNIKIFSRCTAHPCTKPLCVTRYLFASGLFSIVKSSDRLLKRRVRSCCFREQLGYSCEHPLHLLFEVKERAEHGFLLGI